MQLSEVLSLDCTKSAVQCTSKKRALEIISEIAAEYSGQNYTELFECMLSREKMGSIRQQSGLSGFPKRSESEFDTFGVGHSSTSISAAMGMAIAAEKMGYDRKAVAVIGDGAITGGMAFEAPPTAAIVRPT